MDELQLQFNVVAEDDEIKSFIKRILVFAGEQCAAADESNTLLVVQTPDGRWPAFNADGRPVIALGDDSLDHAGCVAHLEEPLTLTALQRALHGALSRLRQDHCSNGNGDDACRFDTLVGISPVIVEARELMAKVAMSDATVLITGESGTGKEVVARALHEASHRREGPFVPVNCAAIPAELLESELFGHEKGAFTGALNARSGRFELAAGGTLLLDEIGDMPLSMQVKVLRAIQDRSFERVGGVTTLHSDVRIIAATHQDLEAMIAAGSFREDLYYRLNVFPIELRPLRERPEDLPLLVSTLLSHIEAEQGINVRLTEDALRALGDYPWPGNVRELKNLLERLVIQFPNELVATSDLPAKFIVPKATPDSAVAACTTEVAIDGDEGRLPVNGLDMKDYLARLERGLIEQALEDTNSVVARAADRLHIRRTTLVEKMRKYGIERGQ